MGFTVQPAVATCVCDWCGFATKHELQPDAPGQLPDGWDTTARFEGYAPYVSRELVCPCCLKLALAAVAEAREMIRCAPGSGPPPSASQP